MSKSINSSTNQNHIQRHLSLPHPFKYLNSESSHLIPKSNLKATNRVLLNPSVACVMVNRVDSSQIKTTIEPNVVTSRKSQHINTCILSKLHLNGRKEQIYRRCGGGGPPSPFLHSGSMSSNRWPCRTCNIHVGYNLALYAFCLVPILPPFGNC
jgi:hypothetical protein